VNKSSAVAEMGNRARAKWAQKWGLYPFQSQELGLYLTQCPLGRGLPAYQVVSWAPQRIATGGHEPSPTFRTSWAQGSASANITERQMRP